MRMLASFVGSEAHSAFLQWLTVHNVDAVELPIYFIVSAYAYPQWPILTEIGKLELRSWGFVPGWVKTKENALTIRRRLINARMETMFELPSFRDASRDGRSIMVASGFYEFHKEGKRSYAFYVYPADGSPLFLGSIASDWTDPASKEVWET